MNCSTKTRFVVGAIIIDFLIMLSGEALWAQGVTHYVDGVNGDNEYGDGTEVNSWETIQYGIDQMSGGDTLVIKAGTYAERITDFPAGTDWQNATVIRANPGDIVTIKPNEADPARLQAIFLNGKNDEYIIFEGLVLDGSDMVDTDMNDPNYVNPRELVRTGIRIDATVKGHIRIQDCEIEQFATGVLSTPDYCEFINLNVHDIVSPDGSLVTWHGIYIRGDYNLVEGGEFHDIKGHGVKLAGSNSTQIYPENNIVRNVTSHDNTFGIFITRALDNLIYNNVCYDNKYSGIAVFSDWQEGQHPQRNKIFNNTCYRNGNPNYDVYGRYAIEVRGLGAEDTEVKNNICYLNLDGPINDTGTNTFLSNNYYDDPGFVDADNLNFRLHPDSPCIDAGIPIASVPDDIDGIRRPKGLEYDIGAFEFDPLNGADLNEDLVVDIVDLNMVLIDWGRSGLAITDTRADANNDGTVDIVDLNTVLIGWGKSVHQAQ